MKIDRLLAVALAIALALPALWAQDQTMTPYSRYGYGMLSDNATAGQKAMGGVGYAMSSGRQANVMNPASYAAIDSLTFLFDMGVNFNTLWAKEGELSESNFSGGLDYITLAFPVAKRLGVSLGLNTFSSTGYAFQEPLSHGSVSRKGNGNINQAYIGVGYSPVKGAYVGANMGYLFGTTINDVYAYTITGSTSLFERYIKVRDWRLDIGAQYALDISRDSRITFGFVFSPGKSLRGNTYGLYYDATNSQSAKPDTVGYTSLKGNYTLPATYGAGINYTWRQRLVLEVDYTYQPWAKAKYATLENFESTALCDRWKLAGGVSYTPAPRGSYLQRMQYRAGAYFNHDYISVLGNNVREVGATLGFGIPVPGYKTVVNLTFEYKHRQAHPNPLIKEQYFNVALGVNFNELWFNTRKIY